MMWTCCSLPNDVELQLTCPVDVQSGLASCMMVVIHLKVLFPDFQVGGHGVSQVHLQFTETRCICGVVNKKERMRPTHGDEAGPAPANTETLQMDESTKVVLAAVSGGLHRLG